MKQILKKMLIGLGLIVMFGAAGVYIASRASLLPTSLNMGSTIMTHSDMSMPNESTHLMSEEEIPVTRLVAPASDAPIKRFTLTAQKSQVDLGQGHMVEAWTYNGTAPGPELRVEQGDRVIVELINRDIEEGVTIH